MNALMFYNTDGKVVGSVELDETVWGIEPNIAVMHQALVRQQANARVGTRRHQDPRRSARRWSQAVAPEGHRPRPAGLDPRAALVGGGVVFGPHPRNYTQDMPKQMRASGGALGAFGQGARRAADS